MPKEKIEPGLAVALAGQVSVGMTPGDGKPERMEGALLAIGFMLINAVQGTDSQEMVESILASPDKTEIQKIDGGGWRITTKENA